MTEHDSVRLRHMLEAAQAAAEDVAGLSRSSLDAQGTTARSVVRCLEVIGEAAGQIAEATRREIPQVPWAEMVAMRNRLIHAYWQVDLDIVWDTVTLDVPPLIEALTEALSRGRPPR